VNIPAVGRIHGRGTVFLVSPGILLTSTRVVGTKHDAAKLTATFFHGTKKGVVEVKLLPNQLYTAAAYPDHLDYCLVACETQGIFTVAPVKLPLIRSEWANVREGDTLLVIQHPVAGEEPPQEDEIKRFEEVIRRRNDLIYFKPNGAYTTAGCPCFNEKAELVGLQSQHHVEGEGLVSRAVSIVTIVKHLFANAQLSRIQQSPSFADVWDTWYVPNDTTRIVSIMANFRNKEIVRQAAVQLCEHTAKRDLVEGVVASGGTKVIIASITQFADDEEMSTLGFRALWNISFGDEDNRQHIIDANGPHVMLDIMSRYPTHEEIQQFGVVILFNLMLGSKGDLGVEQWMHSAISTVMAALVRFEPTEVIQKFGIGFFVSVAKISPHWIDVMLNSGLIDHVITLASSKQHNIFVSENVLAIAAIIASRKADAPRLKELVPLIVDIMLRHRTNNSILLNGNHALWGLGNDSSLRIAILQHPQGHEVLQMSLAPLVASTKIA
jgi:hypothetical protein